MVVRLPRGFQGTTGKQKEWVNHVWNPNLRRTLSITNLRMKHRGNRRAAVKDFRVKNFLIYEVNLKPIRKDCSGLEEKYIKIKRLILISKINLLAQNCFNIKTICKYGAPSQKLTEKHLKGWKEKRKKKRFYPDDLQILPSKETTITDTSSWYLRRSPWGISSSSWKSIPAYWRENHIRYRYKTSNI